MKQILKLAGFASLARFPVSTFGELEGNPTAKKFGFLMTWLRFIMTMKKKKKKKTTLMIFKYESSYLFFKAFVFEKNLGEEQFKFFFFFQKIIFKKDKLIKSKTDHVNIEFVK